MEGAAVAGAQQPASQPAPQTSLTLAEAPPAAARARHRRRGAAAVSNGCDRRTLHLDAADPLYSPGYLSRGRGPEICNQNGAVRNPEG